MIRGQRIRLRQVRSEAECSAWVAAHNELSDRAPADHLELISLPTVIRRFREDGLWGKERGTLFLETCDDRIVGLISFHRTSEFECEIGYRIFRAEDRGQGFMREALPLFSAYLFATMSTLTRLRIMTAAGNEPSCHLAEAGGYTREGVLRKATFYRGRVVDWVAYGLLREECPPLESLATS